MSDGGPESRCRRFRCACASVTLQLNEPSRRTSSRSFASAARCVGEDCAGSLRPGLPAARTRRLLQSPGLLRIQNGADSANPKCLSLSRAVTSGCGLGLPACTGTPRAPVCGHLIDLLPCGTAPPADSAFALVNNTLYHPLTGLWLNFLQARAASAEGGLSRRRAPRCVQWQTTGPDKPSDANIFRTQTFPQWQGCPALAAGGAVPKDTMACFCGGLILAAVPSPLAALRWAPGGGPIVNAADPTACLGFLSGFSSSGGPGLIHDGGLLIWQTCRNNAPSQNWTRLPAAPPGPPAAPPPPFPPSPPPPPTAAAPPPPPASACLPPDLAVAAWKRDLPSFADSGPVDTSASSFNMTALPAPILSPPFAVVSARTGLALTASCCTNSTVPFRYPWREQVGLRTQPRNASDPNQRFTFTTNDFLGFTADELRDSTAIAVAPDAVRAQCVPGRTTQGYRRLPPSAPARSHARSLRCASPRAGPSTLPSRATSEASASPWSWRRATSPPSPCTPHLRDLCCVLFSRHSPFPPPLPPLSRESRFLPTPLKPSPPSSLSPSFRPRCVPPQTTQVPQNQISYGGEPVISNCFGGSHINVSLGDLRWTNKAISQARGPNPAAARRRRLQRLEQRLRVRRRSLTALPSSPQPASPFPPSRCRSASTGGPQRHPSCA